MVTMRGPLMDSSPGMASGVSEAGSAYSDETRSWLARPLGSRACRSLEVIMTRLASTHDVPVGTVIGAGRWVVGNNGEYFAVGRRCRHLGADLANGSIDAEGCLVCPWHQAKYDVRTGRMVRGPQRIFAKIPGLPASFVALTRVLPLRHRAVEVRGDELHLAG